MAKLPLSSWFPVAFAGLCGTLIGLGIGRFSYVALLPLLIDARWASTAGAAQLAAANLIGYLIGALAAHRLALRIGSSRAILGAMLVVVLSLLFCSVNLGIAWLWGWRLLAGAGGGVLMIVSAPAILARVPVAARGKAIGLVFSGIGCGIMLSGIVAPALGAEHLTLAWQVLGVLSALAMAYAWTQLRKPVQTLPTGTPDAASSNAASPSPSPSSSKTGLIPQGALLALLCAYVLDAIGYLPHTVFWVEYLVHGLNRPMSTGGAFWVVFGAGAAIGPLVSGFAADRFGFRRTLIACFAVKAAAVALPLVSTSLVSLFLSSFLVGALTPGMVAVASGRVIEIAGPAAHQRNWAMMTFIYAILQAVGGYGMASLFAATHSFNLLFAIGAATLAISAIIASFGGRPSAPLHDPLRRV